MRKMGNILIQFRMINTVNNFLPQPSLFYLCSKQVAYLSVQLFNNLLSVVVRLTLFLSPSVNAASFSIVSLQVVCSGEWLAITEGHSSTHSNNHASTVTVLLFVEVLHFFFLFLNLIMNYSFVQSAQVTECYYVQQTCKYSFSLISCKLSAYPFL